MKTAYGFIGALLACSLVHAQAIKLDPVRARPQLSLGSISIAASPATVTFNLVSGGKASASSPISITSSGSGIGLLSTMTVYAYFLTSNALVASSGDSIPASAIFGKCPTGALSAFTAFTQTTPLSGASGLLLVQDTSLLSVLAGRTDAFSLQIDLTNQPQLPAGSYSGTLVLQAQAL